MSSITDTNSNSNTIDLRALLESGENVNHVPNAFKQMHSYIKKLEAQNKELKKQEYQHSSIYVGALQNNIIRLKEENEELKEENEGLSQGYSKWFMESCSSDIKIKKLKKENEELQSNLDEMNYQYKCLRDGEAGY